MVSASRKKTAGTGRALPAIGMCAEKDRALSRIRLCQIYRDTPERGGKRSTSSDFTKRPCVDTRPWSWNWKVGSPVFFPMVLNGQNNEMSASIHRADRPRRLSYSFHNIMNEAAGRSGPRASPS